jgi:hypothetical protein
MESFLDWLMSTSNGQAIGSTDELYASLPGTAISTASRCEARGTCTGVGCQGSLMIDGSCERSSPVSRFFTVTV